MMTSNGGISIQTDFAIDRLAIDRLAFEQANKKYLL